MFDCFQKSKDLKGEVCRIESISEKCSYEKLRRFLKGKKMQRVEGAEGVTTGWYSFMFDEDRKELNRAGGWSDNKYRYYLENPKLKKDKDEKQRYSNRKFGKQSGASNGRW